MKKIAQFFMIFIVIFTQNISNADYSSGEVKSFINFMSSEHNYDKDLLKKLFDEIKTEKKIKKYFKKAPERTLTWNGCNKEDKSCVNYKKLFVTKNNVTRGLEFWKNNLLSLKKAEKQFGVPPEIIVSIVGIESKYGSRTGSFKTFDTLASLSLGPNKGRRAKFYRSELINFLLLCKENSLNPRDIKGSYAGALGKPQFISSSYRNYAIDFNNDGKVDLWNSNEDVIGSVANYFRKHGWRYNYPVISEINDGSRSVLESESKKSYKPKTKYITYLSRGLSSTNKLDNQELLSVIGREEPNGKIFNFAHKNFYVITRYNRSRLYALAVYFLSEDIRAAKSKMERL